MRRRIQPFAMLAAAAGLGLVVPSCLDRPVTNSEPETNTNFISVVRNEAIDKVDILFVVDNSASMGDKTQFLIEAVPLLIQRLVQPNCVKADGAIVGPSSDDGLGTCAQGGAVEFPPVHDMHLGLLSSSLGTRLSDQYGGGSGIICDPTATVSGTTIPNHNDDRAELLSRTSPTDPSGVPLVDAGQLNYLSWFPDVPKNQGKTPPSNGTPMTSASNLISDFKGLLTGVGNYGCGIESQLESWYRFLVQPDPYDSLSLDGNGNAQWVGVDSTILAQRASFLRPDSLVAIIDMTDENDSEIDVRSIGGQGYRWMAQNFDPWTGTPSCGENSNDSGLLDTAATCAGGDCTTSTCTSCGFQGQSCTSPDTYTSANDWGNNANLRHVHMMQKYGVWPQFPIQRYVLGLTSKTIPDRNGEYPSGASTYQGLTNRDCVNPLFAQNLPDGSKTDASTLCQLEQGPRTPDLIYYAHIGGVPYQLLQSTPGDGTCAAGTNPADCPQKETLLPTDWTKILGQDPLAFNYTGIDPHMIESYEPRPGIPACPATPDAEGVCDWITNTGSQHVLDVDREYACTFQLATPRDCSQDTPENEFACDCPSTSGLTPQELPPLCGGTPPSTAPQTTQIAAKAYPTQRELLLANLMGTQGFVSSLCPIHTTPASGETSTSDPLFGYNPAVNGLVDRLKVSLSNQCLPETLQQDSAGNVPCLILAQLSGPESPGACENPGAACNASQGLLGPGVVPANSTNGQAPLTQDILDKFCEAQEAQYQANGGGSGEAGAASDPMNLPACALQQLLPITASGAPNTADFPNGASGGCSTAADAGWCYVTGAAANGCPQAILFTSGEPPSGATVSLQCIENSVTVVDGGGSSSSTTESGAGAGD